MENKMHNVFKFVATKRNILGKAATKAMRKNKMIPAILYGGKDAACPISLKYNKVIHNLSNEAVYSHVLNLKINDNFEKVVLKNIQRHPANSQILHMDFMRVDSKHTLKVHVPLHFTNEDICIGVKSGGVITHAMVDVEILCLPDILPEYITVDLADLKLGDAIHLSDLKMPKGVEIIALAQDGDHDYTVAQVTKVREPKVDEEATTTTTDDDAAADEEVASN